MDGPGSVRFGSVRFGSVRQAKSPDSVRFGFDKNFRFGRFLNHVLGMFEKLDKPATPSNYNGLPEPRSHLRTRGQSPRLLIF